MDPAQQLHQQITGAWISQMIYVAAKLGLADLLKDGPRSSDDLARATKVHPPSLFRLLRGLASAGVFAEEQDKFRLTPTADLLRSDRPDSQRAVAIMMGEEHFRCWGDLLYCIETGKTAFDHLYGKPIFPWLAEHPESARIFDAAMTGIHGAETKFMLDAYAFNGITTLVDIGGGNGTVLRDVLLQYPSLQGVLFDQAHVVERAQPGLKAAGLANRCTTVGGDFFQSVPAGADAYIMRHIIHDWNDDQARTILRNCRQAMDPAGRVLVVESVIPPGNEPYFGKLLDLNMLVLPGGQERTEAEYRTLFASAGLELRRIVPTNAEISVLEARPV